MTSSRQRVGGISGNGGIAGRSERLVSAGGRLAVVDGGTGGGASGGWTTMLGGTGGCVAGTAVAGFVACGRTGLGLTQSRKSATGAQLHPDTNRNRVVASRRPMREVV